VDGCLPVNLDRFPQVFMPPTKYMKQKCGNISEIPLKFIRSTSMYNKWILESESWVYESGLDRSNHHYTLYPEIHCNIKRYLDYHCCCEKILKLQTHGIFSSCFCYFQGSNLFDPHRLFECLPKLVMDVGVSFNHWIADSIQPMYCRLYNYPYIWGGIKGIAKVACHAI